MASEQAVEAKLGHKYRKVGEVEDNDLVPRVAYVSPEFIGDAEGALIGGLLYIGVGVGAVLASVGALATVITGGVLGGVLGGDRLTLAKLVGEERKLSARTIRSMVEDCSGCELGTRKTKSESLAFSRSVRGVTFMCTLSPQADN